MPAIADSVKCATTNHSTSGLLSPNDDRSRSSTTALPAIVGSLFCSLLLVSLDQSIVATALAVIAARFDALGEIEWVGTAYILPMTALQPLFGKLADIFGRKRTLLGSIAVFLIGSALAGASRNMSMLCVMRGVQGIGAAGIAPLVMIIIGDIAPPRERGKYQGIVALCWATGSILGPLLGGLLADRADWRWIFFINIPIATLSFALLAFFLRSDQQQHVGNEQDMSTDSASFRQRWKRLDLMGALLFTLSIFCFLLATQWGGRRYVWESPVIIGLYCGFIVIASLAILRWLHYGPPVGRGREEEHVVAVVEPMIALHLLCDRSRLAIYIMDIATSAAMFLNVFYLPIYFQVAHGDKPTMAGIEVLPYLLPIDLVSMASGFIVSRQKGYFKYMFWIGTAMIAIGGGLQSTLSLESGEASQVCFLMITGIGVGFCIQNVYVAAQETAGPDDLAAAISLISFFGHFGFASGVAVGGAIFSNTLAYYLRHTTPLTDKMIKEAQQSPDFLRKLDGDPALRTLVQLAYGSALKWTFLAIACCGFLAFCCSSILLLPQKGVQLDDSHGDGKPSNSDDSSSNSSGSSSVSSNGPTLPIT